MEETIEMVQFREALNQLPWPELTHAYGQATDTPGHLLTLLSDNPNERSHALAELWASICHQGSVYEASCASVPFLIRLLQEGPADVRPAILYLLADLAHRDWHVQRNVRTLRIEHTFDEEHGNQWRHTWWCPGEFLTRGNEYHELRWMTQAYMLVAEGLADYLALLSAGDDSTVQAALHLLAAFPEAGEPLLQAMGKQLADRTRAGDEVLEADALLDLAALLSTDSPRWDCYYDRLIATPEAQSHPLVRYAAAVAFARFRPTATPAEAVAVLVDALVTPQRLDERYELLASADYGTSVHVEACQLLSQLPGSQGVEAIVTALDRGAERWRVLDTVRVAEALLDAAFFGAWVQGRSWSHTTPNPGEVTLEQMAQVLMTGDRRPYDERSYHGYGRSYSYVEAFTFKITCFSIKEEAEYIHARITNTGGAAFTTAQRQALQAILRCEPLWNVHHELLEIYGLPREREDLEGLLSEK